ncbi:hypothetical protein ACIGW8_06620 [Streptomyces sioyaensis]|uniref:hypothetical protein n=1 Tax=Streptomyces sioyaensis TaxID=67364 RepID=UPI0037D101FE
MSGLGAPYAAYAPEGDTASGASEAKAAGTDGGYDGAAPDGLGRAARRRQLARWKKYRRRAAAATALALVGGGLTASLLQNKPATGHAQAAAAPDPTDAATPRTMNSSASSKEPDGHPSRHHDNRPSRGSASRHPTVASTPSAAPTSRPPATTAPAPRHPAAPRATPHTTSAPVGSTHDHHSAAAAPKTTPPPSDSQPGTGTATTSPAQTAPTADPASPTCLLGLVCVG